MIRNSAVRTPQSSTLALAALAAVGILLGSTRDAAAQERPGAARRHPVGRLGQHLLADAGLAEHEDRHVVRRDAAHG